MSRSISEHLEEKSIWCRLEPKLVSLNDLLSKALNAESTETIEKIDHRLVGLLHTEGITEKRKRVIKLVLEEVQKLYKPNSVHQEKRVSIKAGE